MASQKLAVALLLIFFLNTITIHISAVENAELNSMLTVLRASGYEIFSNSIATSSDLTSELLTGKKSFTFFAPTDSAILSSNYISILRCQVIPLRISVADLRSFHSSGSSNYFLTLFNKYGAKIRISNNLITVNNVEIAFPGLAYSRNIAVHGLGGIINCNSDQNSATDSPAVTQNQFPSPPPSSYCELPADSIGFAQVSSWEELNFPPQYSPAYDLWSGGDSEPPAVALEFSENDDPMSFPPTSMLTSESQFAPVNENTFPVRIGEEEVENQASHYIPVIMLEEF